jgi:hypothetical protein
VGPLLLLAPAGGRAAGGGGHLARALWAGVGRGATGSRRRRAPAGPSLSGVARHRLVWGGAPAC